MGLVPAIRRGTRAGGDARDKPGQDGSGMRGLDGRRMILTGGASGIGRAAALRLAAEGCVLGIFDLDEAGAQQTARQCAQAVAYHVDITERDQVAASVASFEATWGPVEGLANVAGWDTPVAFL